MKYRVTLEVEAHQAHADGHFTHDCGVCRFKAGDWVVGSDEYGPRAFSDEEFRRRFTPVEAESAHEHCWHVNNYSTTDRPKYELICCQCRERKLVGELIRVEAKCQHGVGCPAYDSEAIP